MFPRDHCFYSEKALTQLVCNQCPFKMRLCLFSKNDGTSTFIRVPFFFYTFSQVLFDDDDKLNDNVNKIMQPTFTVLSAEVSPIGICEGGLTEVHPLPPEVKTGSQKISVMLFNNIYLTNSVLPVAIIVTMILVAGLIACILYK